MTSTLTYIKDRDINHKQWDAMVHISPKTSAFSSSWYLNQFCTWDALILGDYKSGIALPHRTKWGLKELYQPNFIQLCFWIGETPDEATQSEVLKILKRNFSLIHFNTNLRLTDYSERINLVIPLSQEISTIRKSYSRSLKRNLKNASKSIDLRKTLESSRIVKLYRAIWGDLNPQLNSTSYANLEYLVSKHPSRFFMMEATLESEVIAGIVLLKGKDRLHYILGSSNETGKRENALSLLLDKTIAIHSSSHYTFDFEGSSIPSVKSFYETFGSVNEPFYEVQYAPKVLLALKTAYKKLFKS